VKPQPFTLTPLLQTPPQETVSCHPPNFEPLVDACFSLFSLLTVLPRLPGFFPCYPKTRFFSLWSPSQFCSPPSQNTPFVFLFLKIQQPILPEQSLAQGSLLRGNSGLFITVKGTLFSFYGYQKTTLLRKIWVSTQPTFLPSDGLGIIFGGFFGREAVFSPPSFSPAGFFQSGSAFSPPTCTKKLLLPWRDHAVISSFWPLSYVFETVGPCDVLEVIPR